MVGLFDFNRAQQEAFLSRVIVIAEAGVNHNGDEALARELIDAAANAGADIVKFQTFKADLLVTERAEKANYQNKNDGSTGSQSDMLKKLELNRGSFRRLCDYCVTKNIKFMSTAFDLSCQLSRLIEIADFHLLVTLTFEFKNSYSFS